MKNMAPSWFWKYITNPFPWNIQYLCCLHCYRHSKPISFWKRHRKRALSVCLTWHWQQQTALLPPSAAGRRLNITSLLQKKKRKHSSEAKREQRRWDFKVKTRHEDALLVSWLLLVSCVEEVYTFALDGWDAHKVTGVLICSTVLNELLLNAMKGMLPLRAACACFTFLFLCVARFTSGCRSCEIVEFLASNVCTISLCIV